MTQVPLASHPSLGGSSNGPSSSRAPAAHSHSHSHPRTRTHSPPHRTTRDPGDCDEVKVFKHEEDENDRHSSSSEVDVMNDDKWDLIRGAESSSTSTNRLQISPPSPGEHSHTSNASLPTHPWGNVPFPLGMKPPYHPAYHPHFLYHPFAISPHGAFDPPPPPAHMNMNMNMALGHHPLSHLASAMLATATAQANANPRGGYPPGYPQAILGGGYPYPWGNGSHSHSQLHHQISFPHSHPLFPHLTQGHGHGHGHGRNENSSSVPLPTSSSSSSIDNHNHGNGNGNGAGGRAEGKNGFDKKNSESGKPHIKKPLNAFMLFMKEMRGKVVAELELKESAQINQILGRRWHALQRDEQAKYYEMARRERQLHMQLYPDWSSAQNYKSQREKRRKKHRNGGQGEDKDGVKIKKCRALYGLEQQDKWCKPCRRKKKCVRYLEESLQGNGLSPDDGGPSSSLSSHTTFNQDHDDSDSSASGSDNEESMDLDEGMSPFALMSPSSSSVPSNASNHMPLSPMTPGGLPGSVEDGHNQGPSISSKPIRSPVGTNPHDVNNPLSINQLTGGHNHGHGHGHNHGAHNSHGQCNSASSSLSLSSTTSSLSSSLSIYGSDKVDKYHDKYLHDKPSYNVNIVKSEKQNYNHHNNAQSSRHDKFRGERMDS